MDYELMIEQMRDYFEAGQEDHSAGLCDGILIAGSYAEQEMEKLGKRADELQKIVNDIPMALVKCCYGYNVEDPNWGRQNSINGYAPKILAIKIYRHIFEGMGLKDAKDAIEAAAEQFKQEVLDSKNS